jgi:hypothetical protein
MDYHYNDFTEDDYRELLTIAKSKWCFVDYQNYDIDKRSRLLLWRHDVDISIHRALRLAEIEHEAGVASTFFLMLHSAFYNLLEPAIARKIHSIIALGHAIGLHFDPSFYDDRINSMAQLSDLLEREKGILESCLDAPVVAFSWHNPTVGDWLSMDDDHCAGMINAYGASVRSQYTYVSDSNGIWRYSRLRDVLESGGDEKLHVLTHPEWWQKLPMSPRERIYRSVYGRAGATINLYDTILETHGRENLAGAVSNLGFLKELDVDHYQYFDYLWNNRMLQSLFVELYRLHERQINQLSTAMFCKSWQVPARNVNAFFEDRQSAIDGWRLFQAAFGISWVNASNCSVGTHEEWVAVRNQLIHGRAHLSSERLEEGCVYLCNIIESVAKWGRLQESISYDGITRLEDIGVQTERTADGDLGERLKEAEDNIPSISDKVWNEFLKRARSATLERA